MSKIFFTSDLHLGHANILVHCNRPFGSTGLMLEEIIKQWNKTVDYQDIVYILGDFCLDRQPERFLRYVNALHGMKYFVPGNHDKKCLGKLKGKLNILQSLVEVHYNNTGIVLCHYPLESWNKSHYGAIHLHGHAHGFGSVRKNRLDVGPDNVKNVAPEKQKDKWFHIWELKEILSLFNTAYKGQESK